MSGADKQHHVNLVRIDDDFEQTSTMEETAIKIPEVRQLTRPPEIWELVQPVEASRPGVTNRLTTRLASSRSILILLVAMIVGVGGYLGMRSRKQIAGTTTPPVATASHVYSSKAAATIKQTPIQESNATAPVQESNVPAPVVTSSVSETTAVVAESDKPKRKASHRSKPIVTATEIGNSPAVSPRVSTPEASQVSLQSNQKAQSTNTSKANSPDSAPSSKETSLSPQLINSSKTAPRKPKLIQWP